MKPPLLSRRRVMVVGTAAGSALIGLMLSIPAIGFLLGPLFTTTRSSGWLRVATVESIPFDVPTPRVVAVPTGEGWATPAPNRIVYIVRKRDGTVLALSNICSHMQCDVHWEPKRGADGQFLCPCHGGLYDREGRNVGGPPPSPLPQWVHKLQREGGSTVLYILNRFDYQI